MGTVVPVRLILLAAAALIVLAAFAPVPAGAQDGTDPVTVRFGERSYTADFSPLGPGSDLAFRFSGTLEFHCNGTYPVTMELSANGGDWPGTLDKTSYTCTRDEQVAFGGEVKVPAGTAGGRYPLTVRATVQQPGNFPPSDSDVVEIHVVTNRVQLSGLLTRDVVQQNLTQEVLITVRFRNIGSTKDTFTLEFGPETVTVRPGWLLDRDQDSLDLEPGVEAVVNVRIVVPPDPPLGPVTAVLSAQSSATDSRQEATLTVTVKAPAPVVRPPTPPGFPIPLDLLFFLGLAVAVVVGMWFITGTEVGFFALLVSLIVPLYVRLKRETVLDNFSRGQIFGFIKANPGAHYSEIQHQLELPNGVLAHHLHVLARESFVVAARDGLLKRFYPAHVRISPRRKALSRLQKDVLDAVGNHPGISQHGIARLLGESKQVVHYHIKILSAASLVRVERTGSETRCFGGDAAEAPHPVESDGESERAGAADGETVAAEVSSRVS